MSVPGACEEAGRGGGGGGRAELPPLGALWGPGGRGRILAREQVIKNAGHCVRRYTSAKIFKILQLKTRKRNFPGNPKLGNSFYPMKYVEKIAK